MDAGHFSDRRKFIKTAGKAGLAVSLGSSALSSFAADSSFVKAGAAGDITWVQQPLAYGYNAIEPSIDAMTMEIHYTKHAATYAKNLADAVKEENVNTSNSTIEQLLANISKYSAKMRNNAGGHYNHELFWKSLRKPSSSNQPSGKLADMIKRDFNSFDSLKTQFSDAAKARFGSGWAWIVLTNDKKLVVSSTPNQDNPLMSVADVKGVPVLGLDVWEHAYYLKYQNRRADYLGAFWQVINWNVVAARFEKAS